MDHEQLITDEQARIRIPAEDAFLRLLPEMEALAEQELLTPTVDIMSAVAVVLGALPRLQALRAEIERELVMFDLARFDKLELYTKALHHANALFRAATSEKVNLVDQANELALIRDRLLTDAQSLANYGLLDMESLKGCGKTPGYKALAADIAVLLTVFKEKWPSLRHRTPVTVDVLNDANDRAEELLEAVALKERAPVTASEAGERRRRAFTLFARTYKDAQRAVAYLRPDDEQAEEIAPSIFARAKRRAAVVEAGAGEAAGEGSPKAAAPAGSAGVSVVIDPNGLPITPPLVN